MVRAYPASDCPRIDLDGGRPVRVLRQDQLRNRQGLEGSKSGEGHLCGLPVQREYKEERGTDDTV